LSGDLDQAVVQTASSQLDGVLIPANYLEWRPRSVVTHRFNSTKPKPLLVLPEIHRFQYDGWLRNKDDEVKRNIRTLGLQYADGLSLNLGQRPLGATDLADKGVKEQFVLNVLGFQETKLRRQAERAFPLLTVAGDSNRLFDERRFGPAALVSPSFHTSAADASHDANLELLDIACRVGDKDVLALVQFDGDLLGSSEGDRIAADYSSMPALGFLVWPTGLREQDLIASPKRLEAYVRFIQTLVRHGRPVWQINGGFLAAMLWHVGLTGFSQRLSARDTTGQALPPPPMMRAGRWLYWPRARREIHFDVARKLFGGWDGAEYLRYFCPGCAVCDGALEAEGMAALDRSLETDWRPKERRYVPTDRARRYASAHLVGVRHREAALGQRPLDAIAATLAQDARDLAAYTDTKHLAALSRAAQGLIGAEKRLREPELEFERTKRDKQPSNGP
jgi:hypothetical protein